MRERNLARPLLTKPTGDSVVLETAVICLIPAQILGCKLDYRQLLWLIVKKKYLKSDHFGFMLVIDAKISTGRI